MSKRKIIDGIEVHTGSGNVYRDLGYPDADEMLVKAQLVAKISEIILFGRMRAQLLRMLKNLPERYYESHKLIQGLSRRRCPR